MPTKFDLAFDSRRGGPMERITMSIDEALAKEFDALIAKRGYGSRSEAMRDLLRREVEANRVKYEARAYCVASLSYVYNHHQRDLAERLTAAQHEHHDLVVATMHVHLDHEHCLESVDPQGIDGGSPQLCGPNQGGARSPPRPVNLVTVEPGDKHIRSRRPSAPRPHALDSTILIQSQGSDGIGACAAVGSYAIFLLRTIPYATPRGRPSMDALPATWTALCVLAFIWGSSTASTPITSRRLTG